MANPKPTFEELLKTCKEGVYKTIVTDGFVEKEVVPALKKIIANNWPNVQMTKVDELDLFNNALEFAKFLVRTRFALGYRKPKK